MTALVPQHLSATLACTPSNLREQACKGGDVEVRGITMKGDACFSNFNRSSQTRGDAESLSPGNALDPLR